MPSCSSGAGSFAAPTFLTSPPGDTVRRFVVERAGTIRVSRDTGTNLAPFLDVSARVALGDEGGLLSMAFAPDYAVSGRFYVFLTTGTAGDFDVEIWEYRVSADPDIADPASARRVIVVPHDDATNHVGGQLAFGPDGYLYAGVGDGGLQGDPMNRAQDPAQLLGKILRIDPRGTAPDQHVIPPGNAPGAAPQVWALGLRNPWRFSFDRVTGALLIGDVGYATWEEIDLLPARHGGRHQLRLAQLRGPALRAAASPPSRTSSRRSTSTAHSDASDPCSITGGYVVRDPSVPELAGRYVYADYCSGWVRSLVPTAPAASDDREDVAADPARGPVSFGEDGLCRVYLLSEDGPAYRLASSAPGPATGCPASQVPPVAPTPDPGAPPGPDARRRGARDGAAAARRGAAVGSRRRAAGPARPRPASSRRPSTPRRGGRSACARSAIAARPRSTSRGARPA